VPAQRPPSDPNTPEPDTAPDDRDARRPKLSVAANVATICAAIVRIWRDLTS
jgi:hypothetical protein